MSTASVYVDVPPRGTVLARELLPPVLRECVDRLSPDLRAICGYQLGLDDEYGAGKLIRPAFVLSCAEAAGGSPADPLGAAAAVELIHNATLIHDDVMDGDAQRRHRASVWSRFGVPMAILAGDGLIGLAFEALCASAFLPTCRPALDLAETLRRLAIGQNHDLRYERDLDVSVDACLGMLAAKTGALLGCACRLGAAFAGAPRPWLDRFASFGEHLGLAFQLVDDLLGIWGDPDVTGKPAGADLQARKSSAPVVAALRSRSAGATRLSDLYARPGTFSPATLREVTALIEDSGARDWVEAEARRQLDRAWTYVDDLPLVPAGVADLEDLCALVSTRLC